MMPYDTQHTIQPSMLEDPLRILGSDFPSLDDVTKLAVGFALAHRLLQVWVPGDYESWRRTNHLVVTMGAILSSEHAYVGKSYDVIESVDNVVLHRCHGILLASAPSLRGARDPQQERIILRSAIPTTYALARSEWEQLGAGQLRACIFAGIPMLVDDLVVPGLLRVLEAWARAVVREADYSWGDDDFGNDHRPDDWHPEERVKEARALRAKAKKMGRVAEVHAL